MKHLLFPLCSLLLFMACFKGSNPLLVESFDTPFGVPPFDLIQEKHFMPAFKEGMAQQNKAIEAIIQNPEAATFSNTIDALETSGALLTRVENIFDNLNSANTNDKIQAIAKEVAPLLSKHYDTISMNADLFKRIKTLYDIRDHLGLTTEQMTVLKETYKSFVRNGAGLNDRDKAKLQKINEELSTLSLQFGENVLKETNAFEVVVDKEADLAGLPENVVAQAAETATEKGYEGKWVFTIDKSSMIPYLTFGQNRAIREKLFKAYISKGNHNNELDNKANLTQMASLRVKRANLLGYKTHADFILEENMAKTPAAVYQFLDKIWKPALEVAKKESKSLQKLIDKEGGNFKLQPWDWWYYAEKVKKEKYALDDQALRPYFKLENVRDGAFGVANKLYGITFTELTDIPVYHPDVKAFEVKEADGRHIGILYVDYHPRASKRGGAWMSAYRKQQKLGGEVSPVIVNVCNLTKPTQDAPALLSLEEVETLFHEFGHALHGLLSDCVYPSVSGTDVSTDFVELPSQVMENWALEPEVLRTYAVHYQTGGVIPDELIKRIEKSSKFNQGFITVEYLSAAYLDMDWHTLTDDKLQDAVQFENKSMDKIGLIHEIVVRYKSPYFNHIFAGGYSSGYYSYIWAEVLDADAFQAFKDSGNLFNPKLAQAFRKNVLSAGGSEDPMTLYKRFRGSEPKIDPLLKKRGLK